MSSNIVPFNFEDYQVRVVRIDGEPWFVLADICKVLAIRNVGDTSSRLDDDVKGVATVDTPGGQQQVTIVSEPGMYEVVLLSRKPEAKAFKRWITGTVLPEIRRTGAYGANLRAAAIEQAGFDITVVEKQARILRTLRTSMHPDYAEAKARVLLARAMGEEPQIEPEMRALDVTSYLQALGLSAGDVRQLGPTFGRRVAAQYREELGEAPFKTDRVVNGGTRRVNAYTEAHRGIFDRVRDVMGLGGSAAVLLEEVS